MSRALVMMKKRAVEFIKLLQETQTLLTLCLFRCAHQGKVSPCLRRYHHLRSPLAETQPHRKSIPTRHVDPKKTRRFRAPKIKYCTTTWWIPGNNPWWIPGTTSNIAGYYFYMNLSLQLFNSILFFWHNFSPQHMFHNIKIRSSIIYYN